MLLSKLLFRVLRKLGVLNSLNIFEKLYYGENKICIPVLNGIGYPNLFLKPNWLYYLLNEIFATDGETFIDVGVNIGQTLIAAKSANKNINYVGFEPNSSCCHYLKVLIKKNQFTDCKVYNFALSDQLKESILETNVDADPTASLVQKLRPSFFRNKDYLFALSYDSLGLQNSVKCIKIDIEGGELEALLGMRALISKYRPYIICEILDSHSEDVLSFTQDRATKVCNILKAHDYFIIQLVQNDETGKIVFFKEIDDIKIIQWTRESLMLNDYVFFPSEKKDAIKEIMLKFCS